jgi:hypothetical protein
MKSSTSSTVSLSLLFDPFLFLIWLTLVVVLKYYHVERELGGKVGGKFCHLCFPLPRLGALLNPPVAYHALRCLSE